MAVHWTIPFKSIRSGIVYTVSIYDDSYSGSAIELKGGAEPFVTQEDDSDDMFENLRTQSGYIRIIDDDEDADGNAFSWKDLLPSTDTDRPVILTNGDGDILWQGFMQAQNFGGVLYGNPQEREFPVQCPLSILEGFDIDYEDTSIKNFAYLLNYCINQIPTLTINNIIIQGGSDAQKWLLSCIDWQNFTNVATDGSTSARFNCYECLEDMCRFWGWTARVYGQDLYLVAIDDTVTRSLLTLTTSQLETMASGTSAGTVGGVYTTVAISGDVFASTDNIDYMMRGPNKSTVKVDYNASDDEILGIDQQLITEMKEQGTTTSTVDGGYVTYTIDLTSFSYSLYEGSCVSGSGSFNLAQYVSESSTDNQKVIRITSSYSGTSFVSMALNYEHCYSNNLLKLNGLIYRNAEKFSDYGTDELGQSWGNYSMYIKLGIGKTRATARWLTSHNTWSDTETAVKVYIGNEDSRFVMREDSTVYKFIDVEEGLCGRLFIEFLGSDDLEEIDSVRSFDIADFNIEVGRGGLFGSVIEELWPEWEFFSTSESNDTYEYTSSNSNNIRNEYNADCIYGTDNSSSYGFGLLINSDGTFMDYFSLLGASTTHPEQYLADRVTSYWATAKRKIVGDFRTDTITEITPQNMITLDSTTFYPVSISHSWRDDITTITMMEV